MLSFPNPVTLHSPEIVIRLGVGVLLGNFLGLSRQSISRQKDISLRVVDASIVMHLVVVAFDDDPFLATIPHYIMMND